MDGNDAFLNLTKIDTRSTNTAMTGTDMTSILSVLTESGGLKDGKQIHDEQRRNDYVAYKQLLRSQRRRKANLPFYKCGEIDIIEEKDRTRKGNRFTVFWRL